MTAPIALANGRYLLVSPLGEGGMATVYRAFDQRLQVWRAIKVLAPQYANKPKLRARFETEAQTMALLEHPNIVRVYDVGTDGPSPYIVMELVTGGALVDWLERHGPMPPRMAVETTLAMVAGVQAAHNKGIIHRDIKPHNVMVTHEGVCRVTDFGIARVGDADLSMTKTGAVMGTWGYMAPEQRTNAKSVDVRADVYAVGATLYTLLVDRMPMDLFAAEPGDSIMEGLAEPLVDIILKSSAYRREDRFDDLHAFCAALRESLPLLPETPELTPPLALDPGPTPPIPDPTAYKATPVPAQTTDPSFHTAGMAGLGQMPATSATITPMGAEYTGVDGTLPPGATMPPQPGSSTSAGAQSRDVWQPDSAATLSNTAPPHGVMTDTGRGWVGVALFVLIGLFLLAGVGGAGVYYALMGPSAVDPDPTALVDPEVPPVPDRPDTGVNDPVVPDPVPQVVPTVPEPVPVVPDPRPQPPPRVDPRPQPTVPSPDPQPVVVVVPRPEPAVVPTPTPSVTQCVNASSARTATLGASIAVSASLCSDDGTAVVLWFKPVGSSAWESVNMPRRLGKHVQTVSVTERFAGGIEYYVTAGDYKDGSRLSPKRVMVSP